MKINWGTSIVIAFCLFMSFILFFVFKVQSESKYDNELVVEEYYKHDALYSSELAKIQRSENLPQKPAILNTENGITIVFPTFVKADQLTGKIAMYRPSEKKLDFVIPISLDSQQQIIPLKALAKGRWNVTINWEFSGITYITKSNLYIK